MKTKSTINNALLNSVVSFRYGALIIEGFYKAERSVLYSNTVKAKDFRLIY